jgi:hypothetical protein
MSDPWPKGIVVTFNDKCVSREFKSLDEVMRYCVDEGIAQDLTPDDPDYVAGKITTRFKEGYFIKNTFEIH